MPGAKIVDGSKELEVFDPPKSLSDDFRNKLGQLKEITEEQRKRISRGVKKGIEEWKTDTGELHARLEDYNDLAEGIPRNLNVFYEGGPETHVPITETFIDVYGSVEKRSILNALTIWHSEVEPGFDQLSEFVADFDEMINWKARNEWNIDKAINDVFYPTNRDGLAFLQITWAEEFKKQKDVLLLTSDQEFLTEFPSPEESGVTPEEWQELRAFVQDQASDDFPVEVPIEFEKNIFKGNRAEVVELSDFVSFPANIPSIKHPSCQAYGKRIFYSKTEIQKKIKDGVFYEDQAKKLLKSPSSSNLTSIMQSKDDVDGIKRTNMKDRYECFELVVRGKLDGEKNDEEGNLSENEEFLLTFSQDRNILLGLIDYPYRVDFYAPFKIDSRPNRMRGRGIPERTGPMNDEIDRQHNNRMMTYEISLIPSFKGKKSIKKEFDADAEENIWRPGVIFWLDDPETFEQFKVQPTDLGQSIQEEGNSTKILDTYLGSATSLLSGGVAEGDPNAPGNKTATMIQQSNLRMDVPINELREGVDETGAICQSHLYQFGPPKLEFIKESLENGKTVKKTASIHKKFIRRGLKLKMTGVTVIQNPESEFIKGSQRHGFLMQEPMFANNPRLRIESERDVLRAGRIPERNKYLPSLEEIQAEQVKIQRAAQEQEKQEQIEQNLAKANQDKQIRNAAEGIVESNLNTAG